MEASRRHESLVPLSREHHYALMLCLRIHRGLPVNSGDESWVRAKAGQAAEFFALELTGHFNAEEDVLFPAMRGFTGAPELIDELLSQHREIERLAGQLRQEAGAQLARTLAEFADLLEAHIRKEERELFPIYEKHAGASLAAEVGEAIKSIIGDALQPKNPDLLK